MEDDGVDRRIHRIEDPAEPGDEQDPPLVGRDAVTPGGGGRWGAHGETAPIRRSLAGRDGPVPLQPGPCDSGTAPRGPSDIYSPGSPPPGARRSPLRTSRPPASPRGSRPASAPSRARNPTLLAP